jgi:futalosine hydrolase
MTGSIQPRPVQQPGFADDGYPPLALVAAVEMELVPLRSTLRAAQPLTVGRKPAAGGLLDGVPVILLPAGMGKTNAAHALTALLERGSVRGVLNLGVAGAYPGSGLGVGGVGLASAEFYGDEGVETPQGWISTEGIGIPLLQAGEARWFNHFPFNADLVARAGARLAAAGFTVSTGPFVTVSCCSGTTRRGTEIAERFGAICESMEGAALAHVATLYEVPFLEVRGISNAVEDRDIARWRLKDAVASACGAARALLPVFDPDPG